MGKDATWAKSHLGNSLLGQRYHLGKVVTWAKTHLGNVGWGNGGLGKKGLGQKWQHRYIIKEFFLPVHTAAVFPC